MVVGDIVFLCKHCFIYLFFCFQSGQFSEDMIPTVGFNMRKITKGNVTIKVSTRIYIFEPAKIIFIIYNTNICIKVIFNTFLACGIFVVC